MAKAKKKSAKESSNIFHNIMAASVKVANMNPIIKQFHGDYKHLSIEYTTNFDKDGNPKSYKVIPFIDGEKRNGFVLLNDKMPPNATLKEIESFLYQEAHSRNYKQNSQKREFPID